jgi:hypothetical protein
LILLPSRLETSRNLPSNGRFCSKDVPKPLQLFQRFWGSIERGGSVPTKEQLENRVRELEEENDSLQDQLDQIFDIVALPEEKGED